MIRSIIFLVFFGVLYIQYQTMVDALPEISVEMGNIELKGYTDRILFYIPLKARNSGSKNIAEVTYKIYLEDTLIDERTTSSKLQPGEYASFDLNDITVKNEVLGIVIPAAIKRCRDCRTEDVALRLKIEANLPLHPKLGVLIPRGESTQDILLRRIMGGRTREEFAQQLFNRTSSQ